MSTVDRFVQIRDAAKARGDHNFAAEAQAQLDRMGYQETPDAVAIGGDDAASGSEDDSAGPGGGPSTSSPTETMDPTAPIEKVVLPAPQPGRRTTRKPPKPPKQKET